MTKKPYRDGYVHVVERQCDTCIFRPGNQMDLQPGRVKSMVASATKAGSAIICHSTLGGKQAVCRGFYDLFPTPVLVLAQRIGIIKYTPAEKL